MLSIPFKKSDANIDVAGPLKRYLITNFGEDKAKEYDGDVDQFQNLRKLAVIVEAPTTAGRDALAAYFHAVSTAAPLFPVSDVDVKIAFSWKDAFVPTKKSDQSTLHFERVCVFFNLGALESAAGAACDRGSDEGLKEASRHFQLAAGVFQHIRDDLSGGLLGALTPDLTADGLSLSTTLMLAQAQACFFDKATRDVRRGGTSTKAKVASKLAAKLAQSAHELYQQALDHLRSSSLSSALDKSWGLLTEFQSEYFAAAAHFWEAVATHELADEKGEGYGAEIARYALAEQAVDRALRIANKGSMGANITGACVELQGKVQRGKAAIFKDNQRIYLEPVPPTTSLSPVAAACMVRPTPPAALEPPPATASALFRDLLPRGAKKALDGYKTAVTDIVTLEEGKAREANRAARAELASVGLPGSLEAHDSKGGIPDAVWARICDARQRTGGLAALKGKVEEVESAAERARSVLEAVTRTLDEEERRDDAFRTMYCSGARPAGSGNNAAAAAAYEGVSSRQLALDVRKDAEHYRELWRRARASDKVVMGRMEEPELKEELELIDMNRGEIDKRMPAAAAGGSCGGGGGAVDTSALSMRLMALAQLINERDAAVQQLQERASGEDIAPLLMEAALAAGAGGGGGGGGGGSTETVFTAVADGALASYEPLQRAINGNIERQTGLLGSIMEENERFTRAKAADPATLARERFLQRLHRGQDAFFELHAQLSEGAAFYGDLLRRLAQLNQATEDLVYTQGLQRREYEMQFSYREEAAKQTAVDEELARKMANEANISAPPAPSPAAQALSSHPAHAAYGGGSPANPFAAPQQQQQQQYPPPGYNNSNYYGQQPQYGQPQQPPYGQAPQYPQYNNQQQQLQQQQQQNPQYANIANQQQQQQHYAQYNNSSSGGGGGSQQQPPALPQRPGQYSGPPQVPQRPAAAAAAPAPAPAVSQQGYLLPPGYGANGGDPKVARLVEMGFSQDKSRAALAATNGDVDAAISRLLNGA